MLKKAAIEDDESPRQDVKFCTACGESLENFCFSVESRDVEAVRKNMEKCKKNGKFSGDVCAKYFIARREELI